MKSSLRIIHLVFIRKMDLLILNSTKIGLTSLLRIEQLQTTLDLNLKVVVEEVELVASEAAMNEEI